MKDSICGELYAGTGRAMRVLITGGAGFIGSHLAARLVKEGHWVDILDNFNRFYDPAIKRANVADLQGNERVRIIEGDLLDEALLDRILGDKSHDAIVHLAAWAGVRPSIEQPMLYQKVNVEGTFRICEACRRHKVGRLVFASSSSVYGSRPRGPFREDDPVDTPISPYAATKKAGELVAYTYHHLHGISISCLRYFTVYGPRQRPEMAIHHFARLMSQGKPIPMFGDGSSARDYTYVDDVVDGTVRALERSHGYHIYNLGNSTTVALRDLINLLGQKLDVHPIVEQLPKQAGDVPVTFADISRARTELGYNPATPIHKGLDQFVQWFQQWGLETQSDPAEKQIVTP